MTERGATALALVRLARPDVAIVARTVGRSDGFTVVRGLRALAPACAVIVLGIRADAATMAQARAAGAAAFVTMGRAPEALVATHRAVARSGRVAPGAGQAL